MIRIDIDASGPVFDGRGEQITEDLAAEAVDVVAEAGEEQVTRLMRIYFRNPRPVYWDRVITSHPAYLTAIVHDQGCIYGPWLEGVGSRNATTRFKGYRHWRTTRAELASRVDTIVGPTVDRHVDRLRG
jgi:hypothetical protein